MSQAKIILNQYGPATMQLENENVNIMVNRPTNEPSSKQGLMGGQYLLIGIGGCFSSTFFAAAEAREIKIDGLKIEVTAIIDTTPKRFSSIALDVSCKFCSHPKEFAKLIVLAEKGCISINTIKTQTPVEVRESEQNV